MKVLFTLIIALTSFSAFCQIGNNGGATLGDRTTGIEAIDVSGSISVLVMDNQLTVNSTDYNITIGQVNLYSFNGSLIASKKSTSVSSATLNVSGISSGIYFVAIETNKESLTKKIFISTK